MNLDLSRCKYTPRKYQIEGVEKLVSQSTIGLYDDMGLGKSKQVLDAVQVLFMQGVIDKVLVICPNNVRGVWAGSEWGEIQKHGWDDIPITVTEFHIKTRTWKRGPDIEPRLHVVVTNYDYIRSKARIIQLLPFCTQHTLIVIDEAHNCKNPTAQQTKAVVQLRRSCGRVIELSGTPVTQSIGDLYSLGNILDPKILDCKSNYHFQARYAVKGGYRVNGKPVQIVGWRDVEDITRRFAPYVLRRLKEGNIELPPKLPAVILTATLTPQLWTMYQSMKKDLVAWLSDTTVSHAAQAVVKIMRLQQLTSGFLGGIEKALPDDEELLEETKEVGREKLDLVLSWIADRCAEDANFRLVLWSRFRLELQRLVLELKKKYEHVGAISGSQTPKEREEALRFLDPRTCPSGHVIVIGNPQSGGVGVNLCAANNVLYVSNEHSLMLRLQSEDRTCRLGQTQACWFGDVIAEGPNGQTTIDTVILRALRNKQNIADMTTNAWLRALEVE